MAAEMKGAASIAELEGLLDGAAAGLDRTTSRKMFGCYALWVNDNVFALVWKHGRLGVKLPDPAAYDSLMALKGSEPWKAGPMKMAHWVLVPESFHAKPEEVKRWLAKAHRLCGALEKKTKPAEKAKAKR
jgi:TfoX/Sxy family transcriptional regulator of competence genes